MIDGQLSVKPMTNQVKVNREQNGQNMLIEATIFSCNHYS